jgi:hypothetical protein
MYPQSSPSQLSLLYLPAGLVTETGERFHNQQRVQLLSAVILALVEGYLQTRKPHRLSLYPMQKWLLAVISQVTSCMF